MLTFASPKFNIEINGAMFKLSRRIQKEDKVMDDAELGKRFWEGLEKLTV